MEQQFNPSLVPNPPAAPPVRKQEPSRRKVIGVSLILIALLVGGAVYAWQNSFSTVSLGRLTQDFNFLQRVNESSGAEQVDEEEAGLFSEPMERETQIPSEQEETQIETPVPPEEIARVEPEARSLFTFTAQNNHFVRLLAPNGGETFCLGKQLDIRWEHKGVSMIQFYLQQVGGTLYDLGVFPAGPGVDRESGEVLSIQQASSGTAVLPQAGSDYIVTIVDENDPAIADTSNGTFAIVRCEEE